MSTSPAFLRLVGAGTGEDKAVHYEAVLMTYGEGGENTFEFLAPPHLMEQPADEIIDAFIHHVNEQGSTDVPFRYELNGAIKHGSVLTAMGSLMHKGASFPFVAMISEKR